MRMICHMHWSFLWVLIHGPVGCLLKGTINPKMKAQNNKSCLKICSYNCRSLKNCMHDILQLCETWPNELDILSQLHSDFYGFGYSAVDPLIFWLVDHMAVVQFCIGNVLQTVLNLLIIWIVDLQQWSYPVLLDLFLSSVCTCQQTIMMKLALCMRTCEQKFRPTITIVTVFRCWSLVTLIVMTGRVSSPLCQNLLEIISGWCLMLIAWQMCSHMLVIMVLQPHGLTILYAVVACLLYTSPSPRD